MWYMCFGYEYVTYVQWIWIRGICTIDMNARWCLKYMDKVWNVILQDVKMWLWYMWKDMQLLTMRHDNWYTHDMRFMHYMTDRKRNMKRCKHDWLCICMWPKGLLTVYSSHWNRYVGGIVSLRYNVGNTVPLRFQCRWYRVTEV